MAETKVPAFVGPHGEDWCVRPAQLGPPDNINETQLQWLLVPGPPVSAYLAFVFPRADPTPMTFFHAHPSNWSLHVVLAGAGRHHVDGQTNEIGPGTFIYQGPNVKHSIYPLPNQPLVHVSIQHPSSGYEHSNWIVSEESGTADAFGDVQAFLTRFGSTADLVERLKNEHISSSERWKAFVTNRRKDPK